MSRNKALHRPTLSEVLPDLAARYVPISRWLHGYPKAWFRPDLIAAVTSWGVMVPVALAYAGLAGVPPERLQQAHERPPAPVEHGPIERRSRRAATSA